MINTKRHRILIILPKFPPFNIYGRIAKTTTSLGPICIGTAVNKLAKWDVEIIDENNLNGKDRKFCPRDENGLPDYRKIQAERPADVVGFYGSMTSAIPRLFEIAALYKELGVQTIAGGYHVRYLPEEALANNIDIVCMSEGENTIKEILLALENSTSLHGVAGVCFKDGENVIKTEACHLIEDLDILPFPDFGLLKYAKIKIFPFSSTRGCNMQCEFCAVKDRARHTSPQWAMGNVRYLVENFGARKFFDVSDHFASDHEGAIEFCRLLAEYQKQTGIRLKITVQIRINDALDHELLQAMSNAGICNVAIGIESCIDEELAVMNKGYRSKNLLEWLDTYHKFGFFVHGMMIFGYPEKPEKRIDMPLEERVKRFKDFVRHLDTAQVLLPIPLPGTELTQRLDAEGRLFDLPHEFKDGQFPMFEPNDGTTAEQMQAAVNEIMGKFYDSTHFWRLVTAIGIFPIIMIPQTVTLASLRVRYLTAAFHDWHRLFWRNNSLRFGGNIIVRNWKKSFNRGNFLEQLQKAKEKIARKIGRSGN